MTENKEYNLRNVRIGFNTPYQINKKYINAVKLFLKELERLS
jgi:hypothetical protein